VKPLIEKNEGFAARFALARSLKRQHHFYVGPTNSGKTYQALEALKVAASGVYLAPLRLLAMEVRDTLMAAGVPCNLLTGEERVFAPGARHTASTIEMMNQSERVDVAIIDEIQMLQDPDRGSAWTAALVGVPAAQVFVCGSNAVTPLCLRVLQALDEPYQVTALARMTPLVLEAASVCGPRYGKLKVRAALQKGDAIIAFSRKDVLTLSARIRRWGFSVASIYGALAPEVRRHESARFASGRADIVVATDAIGMGLNLPIRRVIFASIWKFDGSVSRLLNATEVRQIAGRAGRFGLYETGFVNVMEDGERDHVALMLETDDASRMQKLPVSATLAEVTALAARRADNKLAPILDAITGDKLRDEPHFERASAGPQAALATLVDAYAPSLALRDKFRLACAPISLQVQIEKGFFVECVKSVATQSAQPLLALPAWTKSADARYLENAETLSQNLSVYAWLVHQFPPIFVDAAKINGARAQLSAYIERALLTQGGYPATTREIDASPFRKTRGTRGPHGRRR
jgi:ATP-dependent RNA helicase SUPV3L1/SUV3